MSSAIQNSEKLWHDASFTLRRERSRNMRLARTLKERCGGQHVSVEAEVERERDAKYDRAHPKPRGNPERAMPLAFDERGEWMPYIASRIPPRQSEQAHLLLENGLKGKARRQAWCGILARRLNCVENQSHRFFQRCRCFNRYCPTCGPFCFRELFAKHMRLESVVEKLMQHHVGDHRPRVLAKLDITTKKLGRMPTRDEVRRFNQDVRRFFRAIEKRFGVSRKDYGALWCCEFGSGNTNLHAHAVYCGPILPQRERDLKRFGYASLRSRGSAKPGLRESVRGLFEEPSRSEPTGAGHGSETAFSPHLLSDLWSEIRADGSFIVSIKPAKSFELALSHALKYPSKFFDASPSRLVDLEVAFDRVRRVHAVAAFYNPKIERESGDDGNPLNGTCPLCRGLLGEPGFKEERGWFFADELKWEGRQDIEKLRTSARVRTAEFETRLAVALEPPGAGPP